MSNINVLSTTGGGRIDYLDALRGFTMFLVVWHHVSDYAFGLLIPDSALSELFISFRMPMFFFISGLIAYKDPGKWTYNFYKTRLLKKAKVQLIPTVVFFSVAALLFNGLTLNALIENFASGFPSGWWFTEALFIMFLIYFTGSLIANLTTDKFLIPWLIIWVFALALGKDYFQTSSLCEHLALPGIARFFMFFVYGLICRRYIDKFSTVVTHPYSLTFCIILSFILTCVSYSDNALSHNIMALIRTIIGFPFIIVVFAIFYNSREYWAGDNRFSRILTFVGRRTLDIYMLHYFFIPDMKWMTPYIIGVKQAVPQFIVLGGVTAVVILLCLAVSYVLRVSPVLAEYLFGVEIKKSKKENVCEIQLDSNRIPTLGITREVPR